MFDDVFDSVFDDVFDSVEWRCILPVMDNPIEKDKSISDNETKIVSDPVVNRLAGALRADRAIRTPRDAFEALTANLASADYEPAQALRLLELGEASAALVVCDSIGDSTCDSTLSASENHTLPNSTLSLPLLRGRALLALERVGEAAEEFHRVLSEDPECPAALKGLGDVHFAEKKEIIAFTYYERARELSGSAVGLVDRVHFKNASAYPDSEEKLIVHQAEPVAVEAVANSSSMVRVDADLIIDKVAIAPKPALEEIVVRDPSGELRSDAPQVSLTMKRKAEDVAEVSTTDNVHAGTDETQKGFYAAEEASPVEQSSTAETETTENTATEQAESESSQTAHQPAAAKNVAPLKLAERYDSPQRPKHYQTETMADLLLQQGYPDAAVDIFRVLVQENPLPRLQEKLTKAESRQRRSR